MNANSERKAMFLLLFVRDTKTFSAGKVAKTLRGATSNEAQLSKNDLYVNSLKASITQARSSKKQSKQT